jgi:hypothetical protein
LDMEAMRHFHYEKSLHLAYNTAPGEMSFPTRPTAGRLIKRQRRRKHRMCRGQSKISDFTGQDLMVRS